MASGLLVNKSSPPSESSEKRCHKKEILDLSLRISSEAPGTYRIMNQSTLRFSSVMRSIWHMTETEFYKAKQNGLI